jgi:hypothetical protein
LLDACGLDPAREAEIGDRLGELAGRLSVQPV